MKKTLCILMVSIFFILLISCEHVLPANQDEDPVNQPQINDRDKLASEYLKTTEGWSLEYTTTFPADFEDATNNRVITQTFQGHSQQPGESIAFVTTPESRSVIYYNDNNETFSYNGGNTYLICTLFQKIILPADLPDKTAENYEVTNDWYGAGTYVIEPLSSFTTTAGVFSDCIKVTFPSGKLNWTDQTGYGYYILAYDVGIIYYEATLDSDGPLGSSGGKIKYQLSKATQLPPTVLNFTITDESGSAIPESYFNFISWDAPIQASSTGEIIQDVYLPVGDQLSEIYIFREVDEYSEPVYPKTVWIGATESNRVNLGPLVYTLPDFSTVTVTLSPENGATNVDPVTTTALTITFSAPMKRGWSFVTNRDYDSFPFSGDFTWNDDNTVLTVPVSLSYSQNYGMNLNSGRFLSFIDADGRPLEPITWIFSTKNHEDRPTG